MYSVGHVYYAREVLGALIVQSGNLVHVAEHRVDTLAPKMATIMYDRHATHELDSSRCTLR